MIENSLITPPLLSQPVRAADPNHRRVPRLFLPTDELDESQSQPGRPFSRVLIRTEPGFYVLRWRRESPLAPALIYQLCPMVVPQPGVFGGPHPHEWCRPLDRPPRVRAQLDGKDAPIEQVWTTRSLRLVSEAEYHFRLGPLRRWARSSDDPKARSRRPVRLAEFPPLF
jgi:hypothetical protein